MTSSSWLSSPLQIYDQMFGEFGLKAKDMFCDVLREHINEQAAEIPLLNYTSLESIPDGHLVCVHGMIQDMFNVELFVETYGVSGSTEERRSLCFRDYATAEAMQDGEPQDVKFSERYSYYVVPIPGESSWIRVLRNERSKHLLSGNKRLIVDQDMAVCTKRAKGQSYEVKPKSKQRKQFPLSEEEDDETKSGVLVRVYDQTSDSLKVNEMVRVYGILEHARLGSLIEGVDELTAEAKGVEPIPRVHAIVIQKLEHNNPLVDSSDLAAWPLGQLSVDIGSVRSNLMSTLMDCFEGDALLAEYTLLHLISSSSNVESPYTSTLPALNVVNSVAASDCPEPVGSCDLAAASPLLDRLHSLLSGLVTQLAPIQLSLDALNTGPNLIPVRDAAKGALDTGRLQLSKGTQIIVDETLMTTGQLQPRGLLNLRALTLLAAVRRVPYDFQFYTLDWETDCRMLIVSSGQSLIKPTLSVPWMRDPNYTPTGSALAMSEAQWNEMRKFLTLAARSIDRLNIDENLQKLVNDDFVSWRRNKETYVDADEFSIMLCLLRLLCLTHGETDATPEHWRTVCDLEAKRRERLKLATSHST